MSAKAGKKLTAEAVKQLKAETEWVNLRVGSDLMAFYNDVAKLAGVDVDTVIAVVLALVVKKARPQ